MSYLAMPLIELHTDIESSQEICFDLSRSIDLHKISTQHTGEDAIAGITSGLIGMDESVTWRAKHFGLWQTLTSEITEYDRPNHFADKMINGAFESFKHDHYFEKRRNGIVMIDRFNYKSPIGLLGRFADLLFLKKYMTNLLIERNKVIKEFAESGRWKSII